MRGLDPERLEQAVQELRQERRFPTAFDSDFFGRVYSTPQERYGVRLDALGLTGHERVLDAGCGYGQWALALAARNGRVDAIDVAGFRVECLAELAERLDQPNISTAVGSLSSLPYEDAGFDAVFCYGAVFLTDWRRSLAELVRVLRPGGLLYVNANSWGWYLYNLLQSHHASDDFSPRRMAWRTLVESASYYLSGRYRDGWQVLVTPGQLKSALESLGCEQIEVAHEGKAGASTQMGVTPFFAGTKYGITAVYEALCRRSQ